MSQLLLRIYGDSLSLPRASVGIGYRDTYPELVLARCRSLNTPVALYNRSDGGAAVTDLQARFVADSGYFGESADDVAIIQAGIVDCAPRPIPYWLRQQISKLPGHARAPIIRVLHHNRARFIRAGRTWRRTTPTVFGRTMRTWVHDAAQRCAHVYVINIMPTFDAIERHSPGFNKSVSLYNGLIADAVAGSGAHVTLVDVHAHTLAAPDGLDRWVHPGDGHHLTVAGHQMYADQLCRSGPLAEYQ